MMKKFKYLFLILLLSTGGYLITQEVVSLNAFGITVKDEALPNNLPDYPIEAEVIVYDNNIILFEPIEIISPYIFMAN